MEHLDAQQELLDRVVEEFVARCRSGQAPSAAEFARRYRAELAAKDAAVSELLDLLKRGPVTLLYGAHDPLHNQAVVLQAWLRDRLEAPASPGPG